MLRRLIRSLRGRSETVTPERLMRDGYAARNRGELDRALECFTAAASLDPERADAWNAAGMLHLACGEPAEAVTALGRSASGRDRHVPAHSNLLFAMLHDPAVDAHALRAAHERWAARFADPLTPDTPARNAAPPARDRLRIGYLSPDFRKHVVAWFLEPILRAHDREAVEVFAFHAGTREDAVGTRLRSLVEHWVPVAGLDDEATAAAIRAAGIDVLVDLAGHTANARPLVLARKPAAVQVSYLGYIGTTGMRAMDYRLTDAVADPPGLADAWYRESLLHLPGSAYCYTAHPGLPAVTAAPAAAGRQVTFAALNRIEKTSPAALDLWATILLRVPEGRLVIAGTSSRRARERIGARMGSAGIAADRVRFLPGMSYEAFGEQYAGFDIGLDTFPVNGATTICESLWMGVPVVSRAVDRIGGRLGASVLSAAGCADWVATSDSDYVELACALASDRAALGALRSSLRERLSASRLMDAPRFVAALESCLRSAARRTAETAMP